MCQSNKRRCIGVAVKEEGNLSPKRRACGNLMFAVQDQFILKGNGTSPNTHGRPVKQGRRPSRQSPDRGLNDCPRFWHESCFCKQRLPLTVDYHHHHHHPREEDPPPELIRVFLTNKGFVLRCVPKMNRFLQRLCSQTCPTLERALIDGHCILLPVKADSMSRF